MCVCVCLDQLKLQRREVDNLNDELGKERERRHRVGLFHLCRSICVFVCVSVCVFVFSSMCARACSCVRVCVYRAAVLGV